TRNLRQPADVAVRACGARIGDAPELRHQPAIGVHGAGAVFRLCRAARAVVLFCVYAALLGLSPPTVFLAYTGASITRVFFISAATFGATSLYGYTTQRDLTGIGSFLFFGPVGHTHPTPAHH